MAFDLKSLLEKYRNDHKNKVNRILHSIGIPMIVVSLPLVFIAPPVGLALFVLGWIFQFVGHAFEGNMPSFFSNPQFLLVGPIWFWRKIRG